MTVAPQIQSIVINAADHDLLVEFWSALLEVEVAQSFPGFTWLKPQREGGVLVAIQQVPDPAPGRRRLHIDTSVADLDGAVTRILELGGSHVEDHRAGDFSWKVMADPEGNEFCISPAH